MKGQNQRPGGNGFQGLNAKLAAYLNSMSGYPCFARNLFKPNKYAEVICRIDYLRARAFL